MRAPFRLTMAAAFVFAAFTSPLLAKERSSRSTDQLNDAWVEQALGNPELDEGWEQSCRDDWQNDRVSHCEVREFSYPRGKELVAIDGGQNGGMTVMGWDRDEVRILYRVIVRARTEERARELASQVQLEMAKGWLSPQGTFDSSRNEWWTIEVKAWVPRASDLALRTLNGPMSVRNVRSTMILTTTNGPVSLVDLGGAVEARVQNGPLHVALSGARWDGAGLDAEAQNGPLTLSLPANYSTRLTTGTINGPFDFDYAIETPRRRAWVRTTLGKGGPPVRVVTNNGPFHIRER